MEPNLILRCSFSPRFTYRILQGSLFPSSVLRAQHLDRLTPEERAEALKKWRGAGKKNQVTSKCADQSTGKSGRRPVAGHSAALAVKSGTSCAAEQGDVPLCETALDSGYSAAEASDGIEPKIPKI